MVISRHLETEKLKKELINLQKGFYNFVNHFSSNLGPKATDSPQFLG